jgi:hypothetical protein
MLKRIARIVFIFICGYLVIEWISVQHPFNLADFFIALVLQPLQFFMAALALFLGILLNARILKDWVHTVKKILAGQKPIGNTYFWDFVGLLCIFFLLFHLGWEQTLVFLGLSMIYGMISIVF